MPFGNEKREAGIALALSGGGFRAVLFHVGAIWRLNELGLLPELKRISSISGGSISAGVLATRWHKLNFNNGEASNLLKEFVEPLRSFCSRNVDRWSIISGAINPLKSAGDELVDAYRDALQLDVKFKDLSDHGPRFVFNATNYATGSSFRFSKPYCGDYRIGLIEDHDYDVALAVGCSSAFPPVLAPIKIDVDPKQFVRTSGADLYDTKEFRMRLELADGGVYDNLGLETVWGRYETVLVSDGGKPFEFSSEQSTFWPAQILRVTDIGMNQALALRKRMLINAFESEKTKGTYWGIGTDILDYGLPNAIDAPLHKTRELSSIRTRLNKFSEREQCELINWGYAVSDAAVRRHCAQILPRTTTAALPYPNFPLN